MIADNSITTLSLVSLRFDIVRTPHLRLGRPPLARIAIRERPSILVSLNFSGAPPFDGASPRLQVGTSLYWTTATAANLSCLGRRLWFGQNR